MLQLLESEAGKKIFKDEAKIKRNSEVDELLNRCHASEDNDHHDITYVISEYLDIDKMEAADLVSRSVSRLKDNPLYSLVDKIQNILDGENIKEFYDKFSLESI